MEQRIALGQPCGLVPRSTEGMAYALAFGQEFQYLTALDYYVWLGIREGLTDHQIREVAPNEIIRQWPNVAEWTQSIKRLHLKKWWINVKTLGDIHHCLLTRQGDGLFSPNEEQYSFLVQLSQDRLSLDAYETILWFVSDGVTPLSKLKPNIVEYTKFWDTPLKPPSDEALLERVLRMQRVGLLHIQ